MLPLNTVDCSGPNTELTLYVAVETDEHAAISNSPVSHFSSSLLSAACVSSKCVHFIALHA